MILQTSQERYGEGCGFIFEWNTNCIDVYLSHTPRLHFNIAKKDIRLAFLFLNVELTLC